MKRTLSLILAALILSSALAVSSVADETPTPISEAPREQTSEPASEQTPETTDEQTSETTPEQTPESSTEQTPETTPEETPETSNEQTPETTPEQTPEAPPTEEKTPEAEVKSEPHTITISNDMLAKGLVMPNRRTAMEGEAVILTVFEKEYERGGKNYKMQFDGWYSYSDIYFIPVSRTMAFFYMPDEDVTIYPIFKEVDVTEYYDWDSVAKKVDKLHRNENLDVDMEDETVIPDTVLSALSGTDSDVTFTTADCIYTINGKNVKLSKEEDAREGYSLTYKDHELSSIQKRTIRNTDLLSIEVKEKTDHKVSAKLHCFIKKNIDTGYLYRVDHNDYTFVSELDISSGDIRLPIDGSGVYLVTSQIIPDVMMRINVSSDDTVAILNGKILPISAVKNGKLIFKTEERGKLLYSKYTNTYNDVNSHKYKSQINFVSARGLLDGVGVDEFDPNGGITTGEFMRAIARIRRIPDKDAYDYCTQLDIFTYEYDEYDLLSRNEMSVIFTNFINHLIKYPKSFGAYSMEGFDDNGAAWVGARFRELRANDNSFEWRDNATRAEAAYLLQAAIQTVVTGE